MTTKDVSSIFAVFALVLTLSFFIFAFSGIYATDPEIQVKNLFLAQLSTVFSQWATFFLILAYVLRKWNS